MDAANSRAVLQQLRELWAEVLQLPVAEIDVDSHFLLLGGDSLQLVRLLDRVHATFGCSLPAHELARFATPARMLTCCGGAAAGGVAGTAAVPAGTDLAGTALTVADGTPAVAKPAPAVTAARRVPATPVQQGLWLAEQLAAPASLYLASVLVHLEGPLQFAALQQAVDQLFRQYPVLLGRLLHEPQTRALLLELPAETALPARVPLPLQDCDELAWPEAAHTAAQLPIELDRGPLCRLHLFRCSATRHVLLLSCHHVISDGWSGGILLQKLATHYAVALEGGARSAPPVDLGFVGYCRRQAAGASAVEALLPAWQGRLAGMELAQHWLWRDASGAPWPHRLGMHGVAVPATLVGRLRAVARHLHCSLFCCFLDATCVALQSCSGERRQALLLPVAQRLPHEESSVGCFIDTLLLVADWPPGQPAVTALQAAAAAFDAARREQLPLATLAARLRPRLLPDGNPWSSILFAYQSFPQAAAVWPGLQQRLEAVPASAGQHALKLEVLPDAGDWQLRIEYAASLLTPARITTLAAHWLARLHALASGGPAAESD